MRPGVSELTRELANEYHFFHWQLAFPEVFAKGGFDVVLANPPWDQLQFDPQEYFAVRAPQIANAQHMTARNRMIAELEYADPRLFLAYQTMAKQTEHIQLFVHESNRFPLTSRGRINLAPLFAEAVTQIISINGSHGRAGIIVPTGIATDTFTQSFFEFIVSTGRLASLLSFENEEFIFPAVHHSFRFCLLILQTEQASPKPADLVFFLRSVQQASDVRRHFSLTANEFLLLNPNSRTCPVFRSQADTELTK
jgi:hypothetical protein